LVIAPGHIWRAIDSTVIFDLTACQPSPLGWRIKKIIPRWTSQTSFWNARAQKPSLVSQVREPPCPADVPLEETFPGFALATFPVFARPSNGAALASSEWNALVVASVFNALTSTCHILAGNLFAPPLSRSLFPAILYILPVLIHSFPLQYSSRVESSLRTYKPLWSVCDPYHSVRLPSGIVPVFPVAGSIPSSHILHTLQ
jgi:hypothetical protein